MKLTADTITDAQIRGLGEQSATTGRYCDAMWCDYALIAECDRARYDIPPGCDRRSARAHCAKILNARSAL